VGWLFRRKPRDLDQLTLDQLKKAGGDLSKSTELVCYLYLPDESRAQQAAAQLRLAGFAVDVRPAATNPTWLALARIEMVPSRENVAMIRARFETLASQLGGDFDGWEAAVTG
jgi:hypothetical protein